MQLQSGVKIITKYVQNLSHSPGIYQMLDNEKNVLYVGKAKDLKKRVQSYTRYAQLTNRLQRMVAETKQMTFITTHTEFEALLLESNLIGALKPKYNILVYDEKRALFITLSKDHDFPRLSKYRGIVNKKSKFFGPFTSSSTIEKIMVALQKVFLLRTCNDTFFKSRTRPCLQYHIKRCSAPCVGKISSIDYLNLVKQASDFLSGKITPIHSSFITKMEEASERLEYERAAFYRDRIKALAYAQSWQKINTFNVEDVDVIGAVELHNIHCIQLFSFRSGKQINHNISFFKDTADIQLSETMLAFLSQYYSKYIAPKEILVNLNFKDTKFFENAFSESAGYKVNITKPIAGNKLELINYARENALEALKRHININSVNDAILSDMVKIFKLPSIPKRIEVYDNSHTHGINACGAMIVATPDGFCKSAYKRFVFSKIEAKGGDDCGMMYQMILRRFSSIEHKPDLIIVDGGRGQLNAALRALKELHIEQLSVIAMAKGKNRNTDIEAFWIDSLHPIVLDKNSEVLYYLERLRDEAHRFGIESHRAKNIRQIHRSSLDAIEGLGQVRCRALLNYFGSIDRIAAAGLKDLERVYGIGKDLANKIYSHFHQNYI